MFFFLFCVFLGFSIVFSCFVGVLFKSIVGVRVSCLGCAWGFKCFVSVLVYTPVWGWGFFN